MKTSGGKYNLDWSYAPRVNISVKPSALYPQAKPADLEGSVDVMLARLVPIYRKVRKLGGVLCIDMELFKYKETTLEFFRRLRSGPEFQIICICLLYSRPILKIQTVI
ncbi:hypothetical protein DSUL_20563 [Desulfovibrionales bacterium]